MTQQHTAALRLADILDEPDVHYPGNFNTPKRANALLMGLAQEAADELRRLHAENERLKTVPMKYRRIWRKDQRRIAELSAEIDRLTAAQPAPVQERELALYEATQIATWLWKNFYKDTAPQWEVLPDIRGVLSQIDNMVAGLKYDPPATQRQFVGLTDAEVMQTTSGDWTSMFFFARAIEAKLKEKNT
jgi:hypothetical protein